LSHTGAVKDYKLTTSIPNAQTQILPQLKSFEHVHPALWLCLEETNVETQNASAHISPWHQNVQAKQSKNYYQEVTGSTQHDPAAIVEPESRIDKHQIFNFDFGTLSRDLGNLDLTSWF